MYGQLMGIYLNDDWFERMDLFEQAAEDIRDAGFSAVIVFHRGCQLGVLHERVKKRAHALADIFHRAGLKVWVDLDPSELSRDFFDRYKGYGHSAVATHYTGAARGGVLRFVAPTPKGRLAKILGVYRANGRGGFERLSTPHYHHRHIRVHRTYDNSQTRDISWGHVDGKFVGGKAEQRFELTNLSAYESEQLIVYIQYTIFSLIDYSTPQFHRFLHELLREYQGCLYEGVGWDEPGKAPLDFGSYRLSDSMLRQFHERYGYDLVEKLPLLDFGAPSPEKLIVRRDYHKLHLETLFEAQQAFVAAAREVFGAEVASGTHHTWQGEEGSMDFRGGCFDYFRLTENLTAGFTDAKYMDRHGIAYAFRLATSLGKWQGSEQAYVNDWSRKCTNVQMLDYGRLKAALRLNWFAIWYGTGGASACYPEDYTWASARHIAELLDSVNAQLAGYVERPKVAIWDCSDQLVAANDYLQHTYKTFQMNASTRLLRDNVAFDWIGTECLEKASVSGQELKWDNGSYTTLVVPYPVITTDEAWKSLRDFSKAGGQVIFVGPPASWSSSGSDRHTEFAEWTGIHPITYQRYTEDYLSKYPEPKAMPRELDYSYPVEPSRGELMLNREREPVGVRKGSVCYLSGLDPFRELADELHRVTESPFPGVFRHTHWNLFVSPSPSQNRRALTIVNAYDESMDFVGNFAGHEVRGSGVGMVLLKFEAGQCVEAWSDGQPQLFIDGQEQKLKPLAPRTPEAGTPVLSW